MSGDLVWQLTRNYNSFLVKRDGATFTREPLNLTQKHSPKYSGLANKNAFGINAGKDGAAVVLVKSRKASAPSRPAKLYHKYTLTSNARKSVRSIKKTVGATRPDLVHVAAARITRIKRAARVAAKKNTKKAAQQ